MQRITRIVTLLLVCSLTLFMACEGPQGPEGPQGEQGPEGPVGPAGEDGSMMYSGQGAPGSDIGDNGDYYLDTDTGELYGPKDDSGWGNPIMVLKGEDGEDGSQIHAGSGTPDASLGDLGDFYLDQANYDMYGPKTEGGWGSPINLKGADGNANVTRYIFPGHDFSTTPVDRNLIEEVDNPRESAWEVYLVNDVDTPVMYHAPGWVQGDEYGVRQEARSSGGTLIDIVLVNGSGIQFDRIDIIRIEASNTDDQTQKAGDKNKIKPDHLDMTNYKEVAEFYNFGNTEQFEAK